MWNSKVIFVAYDFAVITERNPRGFDSVIGLDGLLNTNDLDWMCLQIAWVVCATRLLNA